jgi:WD40 repeat protein
MKALHKLGLCLATGVVAIGTGLTLYTQHRFGTDPFTHVFRPIRPVMTLPALSEGIRDFQFSPDGQSIFTLSGNLTYIDVTSREGDETAIVRQWDVATGEALAVFANPIEGEEGLRLSFDATTRRVAFEGRESIIRIWDKESGQFLSQVVEPEQRHFFLMGLIPSGALLTQGYGSTMLRFWDAETAAPMMTQEVEFTDNVTIVADQSRLLFVPLFGDNPIEIWDLETGEKQLISDLPSVRPTQSTVNGLALRGDLLAIATRSEIQLRSASTGELMTSIPQAVWSEAIALSGDGELLACVSGRNEITLWHIPSQRRIRKIPIPDGARALTFSPDDTLLAVSDRSDQLHLFQLP